MRAPIPLRSLPLLLPLLPLLSVLATPARADDTAERAAADLLHKRLENERPDDKKLLDGLGGKEIVVVSGSYDHIESVLQAAGVRHTVISPEQVQDYPFTGRMIVMVDCPGNIPRGGIDRIAKFVRAGGLLYTTDWALKGVVEQAFPNTIRHNGQSTGDEVVAVHVDKQDDNLMSSILMRKDQKPSWWLESASYPITVVDKDKVEVLASAPAMKQRYGAAPVVVRFRWEDGEVVHVVSHFYRQMNAQGEQVAANVAVDGYAGLTEAQKKEFKNNASAGASTANVESSYAFQRMTTNLVTGKLGAANKKLDAEYTFDADVGTALAPTAEAPAPPAAAPKTRAGKVKVLETKGTKLKIRDASGEEGWVDAAQVKK